MKGKAQDGYASLKFLKANVAFKLAWIAEFKPQSQELLLNRQAHLGLQILNWVALPLNDNLLAWGLFWPNIAPEQSWGYLFPIPSESRSAHNNPSSAI